MKKLSSTEIDAKDELLEDYFEKSAEVTDQYNKYIEAITNLNYVIADLNSTLGEIENFRQSVYDQMEEYYDSKSEKWQEGEIGTAYRDWMNEWSNATVDLMEELEEQDIDIPDPTLLNEISTKFQD